MTDSEKLELYRQTLAQIVHANGGYLKLPEADDDFIENSGSLMNRLTDDGGIEFRYVIDGQGN